MENWNDGKLVRRLVIRVDEVLKKAHGFISTTTVLAGLLVLSVFLVAMFQPYTTIGKLRVTMPWDPAGNYYNVSNAGPGARPHSENQSGAHDGKTTKIDNSSAQGVDTGILTVDGNGTDVQSALHIIVPQNSSPPSISQPTPPASHGESQSSRRRKSTTRPVCDVSNPNSDICSISPPDYDDVVIQGSPSQSSPVAVTVTYSSQDHLAAAGGPWQVRPYPRKRDPAAMSNVRVVNVDASTSQLPMCDVNHSIPAVVFSTGGYLGNFYHDFTDVLLPLYLTSSKYKGNVLFLVADFKPWWYAKYDPILRGLSRHDPIDLAADSRLHCFHETAVTVGLIKDGELIVDPAARHGTPSIADFTAFLRSIYSLPRQDLTTPAPSRPRLLLVARSHSRRFLNPQDIIQMATSLGFDTVIDDAGTATAGVFGVHSPTEVARMARATNAADVVVGVHGAGLTNLVFMPAGAVLVQVLPLGQLRWAAESCFGEPARRMGLNYVEYEIGVEESSLVDKYPRNHTVFTNPDYYYQKGWGEFGKVYLGDQDVRIDVQRFRGVLVQAMGFIQKERRNKESGS